MAASTYLYSGLLMGLFLLGTVLILVRNRDWRDYSPEGTRTGLAAGLERVATSPTTWIAGFVVLALGLGFAAISYVGGLPVSQSVQGALGAVIAAVLLAAFVAYAFLGVYHTVRYRGLYRSHAVAAGVWIVGLLAVLGIAAVLLTSG